MIVPLVSYAKEKSFYQGNYKGEEFKDGRDRDTLVDLIQWQRKRLICN